jgi:succinyl-CoA synthetase beta subunit
MRPGQLVREVAGKEILRSAGIMVPEGEQAHGSTAAAVARNIGFPVVLKMMGPKLVHKTEAGAVALALNSESEVTTALATMQAAVVAYDPTALTDDFLIEAHVPHPLAEMVVGLRRDPQFGWSLTLGSGGIYVELLQDTKTLLLPTDGSQIVKAIRSLKLFALLDGFRNRPKTDLTSLSAQILSLCHFVQNTKNHLQEIEINPLFIYETHGLAVDALVRCDAVPPV